MQVCADLMGTAFDSVFFTAAALSPTGICAIKFPVSISVLPVAGKAGSVLFTLWPQPQGPVRKELPSHSKAGGEKSEANPRISRGLLCRTKCFATYKMTTPSGSSSGGIFFSDLILCVMVCACLLLGSLIPIVRRRLTAVIFFL